MCAITHASTYPELARTVDGTAHDILMYNDTICVDVTRESDVLARVDIKCYLPSQIGMTDAKPFEIMTHYIEYSTAEQLDERMSLLIDWAGDVIDDLTFSDIYMNAYRADVARLEAYE